MNFKIFSLITILSIFLYASAQTLPIKVTPDTWDFGTITDSKIAKHDFTLENKGTKEVTLRSLPGSCGCMIGRLHERKLKPGEKTTFTVYFQPKGNRALFRWDAKVKTNLDNQPVIIIPLQAYILTTEIVSTGIVNFRVFKQGMQETIKVWMAYHKKQNFKIKKIETDVKGFDIKFEEQKEIFGFYPGKQRGYRIDITPNKNIKLGRNNGRIYIKTNIPGKETVELRLFAYVLGDITTSTNNIRFNVVKQGQKKVKNVILDSHKDFKIIKVESSLKFVSTKLKKIVSSNYHLNVTVNSKGVNPGEFRGVIKVVTDQEINKNIEIKVHGVIVE